MATLTEIVEPIRGIFTVVPPEGEGVCVVCHGAPNPGYRLCYSCQETIAQVTHPVQLVVPISLSRVGEQLHHVLRSYKNVRVPDLRWKFRAQVAATVGLFLDNHSPCISAAAGRSWDAVTVVPSSTGREGTHPLITTLRMIKSWDQDLVETLSKGRVEIGHTRADDEGFDVIAPVAGRSFLLIDDTLTSGARVQSAATALQIAGAQVVGAVVIGRVMNPDFNAVTREAWDRAHRFRFTFDRCCLEKIAS